MVERTLRTVAIVLSGLVILGFALFAVDQARDASERRQDELAGALDPAPTAVGERAREESHGGVREAVDDVNDVLLKPFSSIADTDDLWVQRLVPTLLALLVYGLLLGFLARYTRGWA